MRRTAAAIFAALISAATLAAVEPDDKPPAELPANRPLKEGVEGTLPDGRGVVFAVIDERNAVVDVTWVLSRRKATPKEQRIWKSLQQQLNAAGQGHKVPPLRDGYFEKHKYARLWLTTDTKGMEVGKEFKCDETFKVIGNKEWELESKRRAKIPHLEAQPKRKTP
jgi:hypothetical protein